MTTKKETKTIRTYCDFTREDILAMSSDAKQANSFVGKNLKWIDLSKCPLAHISFYYARLDCANLEHANLKHANLKHANLEHANLKHANLEHANLEHANLAFANLQGAKLRGAYFNDANLFCAKIDRFTRNKYRQLFSKKQLKTMVITD